MFVLYAESLELLPVQEAHGYGELSIYRIKREIAAAGGTLRDESASKLHNAYSASSTALYQRLSMLFRVINQGDETLNMPTYNGGLFSQSSASGQFLDHYAIDDRFLALGLDRLARDVDDRSKALVLIDFKSLGVRQLGSIYEGLLEFKLKLASEPLAVTKSKGKEVYQPLAQVKNPLATLAVGDAYLENDKRERKATGSYYTPDYIVKYIVQHTVGPVLDRTFERLTPRLRAAQKGFRDNAKLADARQKVDGRTQPPTTYWDSPAMQQLVDDCLNIRCLDPAMGSGHFLVEVVDYVTNRLISFLNGWSENPVWAFIERTRDDILDEMERQHVTIDADRLTRVALLKRAVLKRCVYGVDLNSMAVELAKVSLWLDAFTLGAPLSFLDHHLKHGNSLIGARVKDVQDYLDSGEQTQLDMFAGSKFAGVMLATDLMRQVSYLSDNTVGQAAASAQAYRDASDHLAPYKRLLDVYTSRWFGNQPPKKVKSDYVRLFLQDSQTEDWLRDPASPLDDRLIPATQLAATALRAAAQQHFFHWELEFPEVFFAPSTPGGQDVQLREDGGFDAVVGNPPYDELSKDSLGREIQEKDYLKQVPSFRPTQDSAGRLNWYHFFMVLALDLSGSRGRAGMIVPMSWMGDSFTYGVRKWMLENHLPVTIEAFPQKDDPRRRVFFDAKLSTSVYIAEKNYRDSVICARVHPGKDILDIPYYKANLASIKAISPGNLVIPLVTHEGWTLLNRLAFSDRIDTLAGVAAEATSGEIIFNAATWPYMTDDSSYDLILRGSHIQRYELVEIAKQGEPEYLKTEEYLKSSDVDSKAYAHRTDRIVYQEGSAIDAWRRVVPTYLPAGHICGHKICYFANYKVDKFALLAVFGSNLVNWLVEKQSVTNSLPAYLIGNLPFPKITFTTPTDERARHTQRAIDAYADGDGAGALALAQAAIDAEQTDVVHDLLAHLAQRMIDLNKQKQAEVKRFLGWLAPRLQIRPNKDGKTAIESLAGTQARAFADYLGDYQKGQRHLRFTSELNEDDFSYFLHKNRARLGANLGEIEGAIEQEYERSLAVLLPIKRDLARTDTLIDKIAYRLYGLTDAEIELIERPHYQRALTEAKAQVVADQAIKDDEAKLDKIADNLLHAAERFFERVEPTPDEMALNHDLPAWRTLPPEAPTFLLTGDYNLRSLPEHMDSSTSIIPYTKAVEVTLYRRIFVPFRDTSGYSDADCKNEFLRDFMKGKKHLTLGSFMIILSSSKETALRAFIGRQIAEAARRVFGSDGAVSILNDDAMRDIRNKAAHADVLTRDDAQRTRDWALRVLAQM
jgi:Eco57I restriction-modification methylase